MAKQTQKERAIAYLESQGWVRDLTQRTTKYAAYRQGTAVYFLGNSGAIHFSRTGKLVDAVSMADTIKRLIRKWEELP